MRSLIVVSCSQCGDSVRRLEEPRRAVLCPKCCADTDHSDSKMLADSARRLLDAQLLTLDATGGYQTAMFDPSDVTTKWQRQSARALADHTGRLANQTPGRTGLVFVGPTGIGKTHAAVSIAQRAAVTYPRGVWVLSETDLLHPSVAPWELAGHVQRILAGRHTLVVDDIGTVARPVDQVMSAWRMVTDMLYASADPVMFIATTNRTTWDGLAEWMGAQATSRLSGFVSLVTTGWTDHRSGAEHQTWRSLLTRTASSQQS